MGASCTSWGACGTEEVAPGHPLRGVSVFHLSGPMLASVQATGLGSACSVCDVEPLIRQPGAHLVCPRDGRKGAAYVDAIRGPSAAGRSQAMLSYSWGYAVKDIAETLTQYCRAREQEPRGCYVWICCLCVNQHRVQEARAANQVVSFEDFKATFQERVESIDQVVAMMTPWRKPRYLTRVWCVFELFTAHVQGKEVAIVLPPGELEDFHANMATKEGADEMYAVLSGVRIEEADASVREDKESILELIRESVGFDALNYAVVSRMRNWLVESYEAAMWKRVALDSADPDEAAEMALSVGRMLDQCSVPARAISALEKSESLFERAGHRESAGTVSALILRACVLGHRGAPGDHELAASLSEKALGIMARMESLESEAGVKLLTTTMGLAVMRGDHNAARPYGTMVCRILEELGDTDSKLYAKTMCTVGWNATLTGECEEGLWRLERARAILEEADTASPGTACCKWMLAHAQAATGRMEEATSTIEECISLWVRIGETSGLLLAHAYFFRALMRVQHGDEAGAAADVARAHAHQLGPEAALHDRSRISKLFGEDALQRVLAAARAHGVLTALSL